jgi:two-component system OmpR family response regulator
MRVLVIEDEPGVAAFIAQGLRESSCIVTCAGNGRDGLRLATTESFDAIVLDLMLPGLDGFAVLRRLRESGGQTLVMCLTARDSVEDRVRGLNLGADDYLAKPFSFSELLARLNALLRRGPRFLDNPVVIGDLTVNLLTRVVQRGGRRIDLSPREFSLLEYMARHEGHILSRTMLLEHVWDMNQDPLTNVIDVHVNRLRKKIDHGFEHPLIHTIRGVGYTLRMGSPCEASTE